MEELPDSSEWGVSGTCAGGSTECTDDSYVQHGFLIFCYFHTVGGEDGEV